MDKPIYLRFAILELSKLLMYQTYYEKLQPYFGQEKLQLHYMDTVSFALSANIKNIIKDLKNHEELFDFINGVKLMKNLVTKKQKSYWKN